ncbi:Uncharacterized protein SCG7109_AN_00190 [Chlamydiales bacterium SCGC AG-110-M15]|nr:Uncharacterized protein SCG7109_AN_00190 [Chlamydiales bacterium SCGC AG-110-M15]
MSQALKIANVQGFWGDRNRAAAELLNQQADIDVLTLDYLAEVSMSIMAIQREKNPNHGYARDFIDVIKSVIPFWQKGAKFKIICNAGGLNPLACAEACKKVLEAAQCSKKIGVVYGDDVLSIMQDSPPDTFKHLDTGEPLGTHQEKLVTANAYLGAKPLVKALSDGADIVITGRVADPSLVVAACVHHFNWDWTDHDLLAGATIAGHLIECGTQVCGGFSTHWLDVPEPAKMGFPIVEINPDGSCVVTKADGSGGVVNEQTVKEQLLYEIADPNNYLSPDVTMSFLKLKVEKEAENRMRVSGACGRQCSDFFKVSATYRNGFKSEGMLTIFGHDAILKGRRCGELILQRVRDAGFDLQSSHVECLGACDSVPGVFSEPVDLRELVLRVSVFDLRREAVEQFTRELAPMVTSGPQGVTGYNSGRPKVRPVFTYWPCLLNKEHVTEKVSIVDVGMVKS